MVLEWGRFVFGEKDSSALCRRKTLNGGGNTGKMVVKVQ